MSPRYLDVPSERERLLVWCEVTLMAPARIGAGEDPLVDEAVLRDPQSGRPLLPGTTLAGVFRAALRDRRDDELARHCFGVALGESGQSSRLIIDDALARDGWEIEVRSGVALDPAQGTALPNHLYDRELLAAGTTFPLCIEAGLVGRKEEDEATLTGLIDCLWLLEQGEIAVGSGVRSGFGRLRTRPGSLRWRRFDLTGPEGLAAWLAFGLQGEPAGSGGRVGSVADFAGLSGLATYTPPPVSANSLTVEVTVRNPGSLLVRVPGPVEAEGKAPDHAHLSRRVPEGRVPVLPATSLKGVLRARARRIAATVAGDGPEVRQLEQNLFGSRPGEPDPVAGRVFMAEADLEESRTLRHTRVAISRWTGAALPGRLFTSDAVFGGRALVRWVVRDCAATDLGWLLLVLKDWWEEGLVLGGETGAGRGVLEVESVRLVRTGPEGTAVWMWQRPPEAGGDVIIEGEESTLEEAVAVFRAHLTGGRGAVHE